MSAPRKQVELVDAARLLCMTANEICQKSNRLRVRAAELQRVAATLRAQIKATRNQ